MPTEYEFIKEPGARAEEAAKKLLHAPNTALDTETTGLDPHTDKVILLSLATRADGVFVVDTRDPKMLQIFADFLRSDKIKTTHNGIFDYQMILGSSAIKTEHMLCTMLAEQALTSGLQWSGYGLDDLAMKYLGIKMDKSIRKSFIGHTGEFTKEQLDYAANDTYYLLDIGKKQHDLLTEKGLRKTWKIECDAIPSFGDMEFYGQRVDADKWRENMKVNLGLAEEAKKKLDFYFEGVCDRNLFGELDTDYDSSAWLLRKLQELGVKVDGKLVENTNKKTQKKLSTLPLMKALAAYRSAMKGYGTYGESYIKAIHPVTGRVHFRFNQYGTETGRPACRGGLNCLNIPRELRYREAFGTEEGRLISTVDYSGAELRILADLSKDPLMVSGFKSGTDFHCYVAALLFGKDSVSKKDPLRTPAKTINFGLAYGMGPASLSEQINAAGYPITVDECRNIFNTYMVKFKEAISWLKAQQRHASTHFKMTNINGRTRHWIEPSREKFYNEFADDKLSEMQVRELADKKYRGAIAAIQREGANFKIQSVNADFSKVAMARCRKEFMRRGWDARTYNQVYDEIVYDFHESYAEEAHELQKKIMLEAANEMLTQVPMEVEGHLAPVWTK